MFQYLTLHLFYFENRESDEDEEDEESELSN